MISYRYVATSKLEHSLKHTGVRGCTAETLKEALAFLDHVEANQYPAATINMPAIPPLAEGEQSEPIAPCVRPPGDPGYSIQLEAPPTIDARLCRALASRLLDAIELRTVSTELNSMKLIGVAIEFATRLAHVIHWYNGVVADYLEGLRNSEQLKEQKLKLSARQSANRKGKTKLTPKERAIVIEAMKTECRRHGTSATAAAKKIANQLRTGEFSKIEGAICIEAETLRGYDQPQIPVPLVMKVGVKGTPLGCWSGGVAVAEAAQRAANAAGATYPREPCGRWWL